jgi:hypothetical protein
MRTSQRRSIRLVADLKPIRVREVYAEAAPSPEIATEQSILSDNRPPIEAPFLGLLGLFASITDNASNVAGDLLYVKGAILARSRSTIARRAAAEGKGGAEHDGAGDESPKQESDFTLREHCEEDWSEKGKRGPSAKRKELRHRE